MFLLLFVWLLWLLVLLLVLCCCFVKFMLEFVHLVVMEVDFNDDVEMV